MADYQVKFSKRTGKRTFDNYSEGLGFALDTTDLEEQMAKLKDFPQVANREWDKAMNKSVRALHSEVTTRAPVDTGELRGSMGSRVWSDDLLSVVGEVGSNVDEIWPLVVELGRKPGKMPPTGAGFPFPLARAIALKGTKGKFFMYHGKNAAAERIEQYFRQANDEIVRDLEVRQKGGADGAQ